MDREIKFRGMLKLNNQWIFGGYMNPDRLGAFRQDGSLWTAEVYPDTVGQFTGFKDMDDKDIYEGDILEHNGKYKDRIVVKDIREFTHRGFAHHFKIIGNRFDNPELLKGGAVDD